MIFINFLAFLCCQVVTLDIASLLLTDFGRLFFGRFEKVTTELVHCIRSNLAFRGLQCVRLLREFPDLPDNRLGGGTRNHSEALLAEFENKWKF